MTQGLRRFHVGDRLSEMTIHNGTVYLAGQVANDAGLVQRARSHDATALVGHDVGRPAEVQANDGHGK